MIGGLIKSNRVAALAGAGFIASALAVSPAQAADLGGDCCADLEERVATLEATTARKGNRKVSLTISGWVNTGLFIWDDSYDSDAYVVSENGTTLGTRITFAGDAKINSQWSAGYNITIEAQQDDPLLGGLNQTTDDTTANFSLFYSYMWIKNEQLGKISIGQQSQATDNLTVVDTAGVIFAELPIIFDGNTFILRNQNTGALENAGRTWASALNCTGIGMDCNGVAHNVIRYDSPTISGFSLSASWGEDDFWDVALRYAGEFGDIKVAAAIGYSEEDGDAGGLAAGADSELLEIAGSIMHKPTGLFVNAAYSDYEISTGVDVDAWHVTAGIKQKWNSLGATAIYGEYGEYSDNVLGCVDTDAATAGCQDDGLAGSSADVERYGVGIHQWIDAAAMQVYAKWEHLELESNNVRIDGNEIDKYTLGGVIFF